MLGGRKGVRGEKGGQVPFLRVGGEGEGGRKGVRYPFCVLGEKGSLSPGATGCGEKGGQVPFLRVGGEGESFPGRHGLRMVVSNPNWATAFATHFSEPYGRLLLIA